MASFPCNGSSGAVQRLDSGRRRAGPHRRDASWPPVFRRALIECFAGTALRKDITSVFDKLEAVLSPAMKKFLDKLPRAISAKHEHAKRQGAHTYEITARLLDAILGQ